MGKLIFSIIVAVLLMFEAADAGTMYKCKGEGKFDSPIWTDKPCAEGREIKTMKTTDYARPSAEEQRIEDMVRVHKIYVGMPKADVIRSWGKPDRITSTYTDAGRSDMMVYGVTFVHINKDVVTIIQKPDIEGAKGKKVPGKEIGTVRTGTYDYRDYN